MKILILEDEQLSANYLKDLLIRQDRNIEVVGIIPSVVQAAKWLSTQQQPDLIFMDIHLEDALVFDLFPKVNIVTPIIFATAYDEYVIRAFKVNSIDYLLKPVQASDVADALTKYHQIKDHYNSTSYRDVLDQIAKRSVGYKDRFMITAGNRISSVQASQIAYFHIDSRVTHLITHDAQQMVIGHTLDELTEILDPTKFFRVNRQCIVSVDAIVNGNIQSSGRMKLQLKPASRTEVLVSGDRITAFKDWMGK